MPQNKHIINQSILNNLQMISIILGNNKKLTISNSQSSINTNNNHTNNNNKIHPQIQQYYPSLAYILTNIQHPFKCITVYTKLLSTHISYLDNINNQPILQLTLFSQKLYGLLTCYLYDKTCFYKLHQSSQKIVDIFYKFIYCQHGQLMQQYLQSGNMINIGKWFFQQGLQKMFKKYYFTSYDFTYFLAKFMVHGLAVLFIAALCVIGKKQLVDELDNQVEFVKFAYIRKYGLQ